MTDHRPPPAWLAWTAFAFLCIALFGNYYVYDSVGPVADLLQKQLGFSDQQIGTLNAIYSAPNIVLVLAGGILVDRFGAGKAIFWLSGICFAGALVTAAAPGFGTMALGRLIFGIGAESMIVATTVAVAQWFRSATLGLALGLNLSFGRLGSYGADLSPTIAAPLYEQGWQPPLWLAAALAGLAFVAAGAFWALERRARSRYALGEKMGSDPNFSFSDVWRFERSFWYVVVLCVTFYSVIFPFRSTFAIKYFQHARHLPLDAASLMNSHVFLAAIIATPLFGLMVDRFGHRALFMVLGSLMLPLCFLVLGMTDWNLWVSTVLIGLSFSLVPAVLWPSVTFLVEQRRFGTAFGLMTMLQNIGLTLGNLVAGYLNDAYGASESNPAGYTPMLWFFGLLSLVAFVFAMLLWKRETGPHGHGLERP
ncbi:MAG: MFS transporter [Usitatibacter sp.]